MEGVTSTVTAIKKMIHANARKTPPARLVPPPPLSLPGVGDRESTAGKPPHPPGTRHPADFALGSRVGNTDLKALILPDDGDA